MIHTNLKETEKKNYLSEIGYKFFPYWPILAIVSLLFLIPALFFYFVIQPSHTITSAIVISDLNNRNNEDPNLRFINIYGSQKVVENEVRVLQSRSLMQEVVTNLALYAPVYETSVFSKVPAYTTSPITIRARNPETLKGTRKNVSFDFEEATGTVLIDGKSYELNEWHSLPAGELLFEKNPRQRNSPEGPLAFSLNNTLVTTESLLKKLQVSSEGKLSSIINIVYTDVVPERGVDIVAKLLEVYNRSSLGVQNQLAENTLTFAEERINELGAELNSLERRIQQFRSAQGVIDLSEQGRLYLQDISDNQRRGAEINVQLAVLEQVGNYLDGNAQAGIVPTSLGIEDPVLTLLLERLNQLELQYASLQTTIGGNNPLVRSVENEIAKIRPNIREIVANQKARLQASLNNIQSTTNEFSSQLRDIPEQERELLEISREQTTKREIYTYLLQKREEAGIAAAATMSDIRVFEEPQASTRPSGSRRMLLFIIAIFLAVMATIGFVLYREYFTNKIMFRSALEKYLPLPVVAEVFYDDDFNSTSGNEPISQQLFQLQLALGIFDEEKKKKKILITSAIPNDGKTFIISQLAIKLAHSGKRVILLDFDWNKAEVSSLYNLHSMPGLKDYFEGKKDISKLIHTSKHQNLDIIPAGARGVKTELLLTKSLNKLFQHLESMYDFILIDTPSVEQASDAFILNKNADASIFVVRHNHTPTTALAKLQSSGDFESLKDAVVIFNGIKGRGFLKTHYGYTMGYGYDTPYATPT